MYLSLKTLQIAVNPTVQDAFKAIMRNNARGLLAAYDITDNSTGSVGSALAPVNVQATKVAASGTNLSPRAGFNTAIGKVDNAIAVLAGVLNAQVLAKLGLTQLSGMTGTVAVAGTVPAQDKTLTGVDGTSNTAMLRSEANAALTRARNNLATLVKAYNIGATAVGVATLNDLTGGSSAFGSSMVIGGAVTATTSVLSANVATSDLAADTNVDAALTAIANNIAFLASKIETVLLDATTLATKVPCVLVP